MGHRVVVLEAGCQAGGRARPFYRVLFEDGGSFDYVGDEERLLAQIGAMSPGDVDGYRKLAAHAERIFDVGYTQLADQPFDRLADMLRVIPDMLKLENHRSVHGLVSKYLKDPRLRQVFTFQRLLIGGNPFRATSIYLLIHWLERKWGVHYAKGGTHTLVKALVQLLGELDVEMRTDCAVDRIEVTDGRASAVVTEHGERIACASVVSNGDPSHTYRELIDSAHRRKHTDRRIGRVKQSMGLFVTYFGTDRPYADLAHHTIVLGPRYKGLLTDVFDKKVLAPDMSLYLHAPGRLDPTMAPPGKEALYVLSPVTNLRAGVDWSDVGDAYRAQVLETLERRCMPGLRKSLEVDFHVDPVYFRDQLRSVDGAAFGPEPRLTQSAYFRYHNRSEDVDGLYFVGAGTHPGVGGPGVLCSAKALERIVDAPAPGEAVPLPPTLHRVSA
jgi:phytoene desaturase